MRHAGGHLLGGIFNAGSAALSAQWKGMAMSASEHRELEVPSNVPRAVVVDWDIYRNNPPVADLQKHWAALRGKVAGSICWTPHNGGHWIVLNSANITTVLREYDRFSSDHIIVPPNTDRPHREIPAEMDPPESLQYRRAIMPPLAQNALAQLEPTIRGLTAELTRAVIDRHECEFMTAFANQLPILVFLDLMGLPREDGAALRPVAARFMTTDSPDVRLEMHHELFDYATGWIEKRRRNPGADFLSSLVTANIGGRFMTNMELSSIVTTMLLGGLDTVTNMLGFFVIHLARHPEHRAQLVSEPGLIKDAVEELLRRYSHATPARVVVNDTVLDGMQLRKGDMVQVPTLLFGLDETIIDKPFMVDFKRRDRPHAVFGEGPHVCVGQHLARRELRIFLEEWLAQIPDFDLKPGTTPSIVSGAVGGPTRVELCW